MVYASKMCRATRSKIVSRLKEENQKQNKFVKVVPRMFIVSLFLRERYS